MAAPYSTPSWIKLLFDRLHPPRTAVEQRVYTQMQSLLVRLLVPMAVINLVNGLIYSIAFLQVVAAWKVAVWFTPVALYSLMQTLAYRRLSKNKVPRRVTGRFLRKAEVSSLGLGLIWGGSTYLFHSDNQLANLFICIVIAGMGAGTMSILGPVARVGSRFLVGAVAVMLATIILTNSPFAVEVTLLALSFTAALLIGGARNFANVYEMIEQSLQSETAEELLADAIESSNDAFAFYDTHGDLIVANARHRDWIGTEKPDFHIGEDRVPVLLKNGRWLMRSSRETGKGGAVVVHTDITALKTRERELMEAQREAVEADAAKSRFLSTMSHELRTPLNIILGFSKLMNGDSKIRLSEEDVREYSDNIHSSGTHLLKLINDIIDYSKVGLDRIAINATAVETKTILSEAITLAAGFESKPAADTFDVTISPKLSMMMVDETALKRILINLLTNAIRFNRKDRKVVIRAGVGADGHPFIAVRDFGPGIPENRLERVFEAFYQGDSNLDRDYGGTGLGLTLCRHLARLLSGDVVLKSRVGVGTTAILTLPSSALIHDEQITANAGEDSDLDVA